MPGWVGPLPGGEVGGYYKLRGKLMDNLEQYLFDNQELITDFLKDNKALMKQHMAELTFGSYPEKQSNLSA